MALRHFADFVNVNHVHNLNTRQCKCFSHTQCSKLGALFFQEIWIQRFWLMMPKPPFPPQVPLEPHFKGEWWVRLAGLSGLSFNHKWDPLPTPPLPCLSLHPHLSLSTSLTLPHCPRSLPLWVREIAVSALSSFSPPPPTKPSFTFLFRLYAFPAHHWSGASVPPGWLSCRHLGAAESSSVREKERWKDGEGCWRG